MSWLKWLIAAAFAAGLIAFFALGGADYLTLEALKANRDLLLRYTQEHYALMLLASFLVYTASTALSVPGGLVLSLAVGFLFGRWVGTLLIVCAATLGATLVFLAARYLFADAARKRLGELGERINRGFTANAFHYLLFLRLVPIFPFWLVNLAPAFTSVPTRTFVAATAIGIVPGTFVYANLGQSLGRIDSTSQLVSGEVLLALGLLGCLALLPVLARRLRSQP